MSHFTVLTVHKDGEDPEQLLAPFVEEVDENSPYAEFENTTEEDKKEYETRGVPKAYPNRLDITKVDYNKFKVSGFVEIKRYKPDLFKDAPASAQYVTLSYFEEGEGWKDQLHGIIHNVRKNYNSDPKAETYDLEVYELEPIGEFPHKKRYKNFQEFEKAWNGNRFNEEHQGYGYWHNPNAKWDWYSMGGRWTGYFKPKKGSKSGVLGNRGAFGTPPDDPSYVDQIRFDEIDFEGMAVDELAKAKKYWKEYKAKLKAGDKSAGFLYGIEKGMTRKAYIEKRTANGGWQPFAFIDKDGEWHEVGSMGWFGMVSDEDREGHEDNFAQFVKTLEPDDILTIWDCHI